jgi:hypothetical protein
MLSIFKFTRQPMAKFRVIQEHWLLNKCHFGSDDPSVVAAWLQQNGGRGQPVRFDAGLHVRTEFGLVRSGPALDAWIDAHLVDLAEQPEQCLK